MCSGSAPSAPPPAPPPPPPAPPVNEVSIQNAANKSTAAVDKRKQIGVSKLQVPLNSNVGGPSGLGIPK